MSGSKGGRQWIEEVRIQRFITYFQRILPRVLTEQIVSRYQTQTDLNASCPETATITKMAKTYSAADLLKGDAGEQTFLKLWLREQGDERWSTAKYGTLNYFAEYYLDARDLTHKATRPADAEQFVAKKSKILPDTPTVFKITSPLTPFARSRVTTRRSASKEAEEKARRLEAEGEAAFNRKADELAAAQALTAVQTAALSGGDLAQRTDDLTSANQPPFEDQALQNWNQYPVVAQQVSNWEQLQPSGTGQLTDLSYQYNFGSQSQATNYQELELTCTETSGQPTASASTSTTVDQGQGLSASSQGETNKPPPGGEDSLQGSASAETS